MAESKVVLSSKPFDPTGGVKDGKNPIIFLHPMLCSKVTWGDIPQTVADRTGRRVYTYDARNHGNSTFTDESKFSHNVDDLFSFIEGLEDAKQKVILVGFDMGGMTAIRAALKEPSKFEMVFIVEMYAKTVDSKIIDRTKAFITLWTESVNELPEGTPLEDVTRLSVTSLYEKLEPGKKEENEKESYLKGKFEYKKTEKGQWDAHYNTEALVNALDDLDKHQKEPLEEYKGEYTGPSYFIYGTKSHYKVDEAKASMMKHFPNGELIPVENGSHFFIADKPAELAKIIGDKISGV